MDSQPSCKELWVVCGIGTSRDSREIGMLRAIVFILANVVKK